MVQLVHLVRLGKDVSLAVFHYRGLNLVRNPLQLGHLQRPGACKQSSLSGSPPLTPQLLRFSSPHLQRPQD